MLIAKKWGRPVGCNERTTIAKEIELAVSLLPLCSSRSFAAAEWNSLLAGAL
jgi:hypothetical protein